MTLMMMKNYCEGENCPLKLTCVKFKRMLSRKIYKEAINEAIVPAKTEHGCNDYETNNVG